MKKHTFTAALMALLLTFTLTACETSNDSQTTTTSDIATTTATTSATTTRNPILDKIPQDDPETQEKVETPTDFKVGTAEELVAAITALNDLEATADSTITLTADIDLSGYTTCENWEPIYRFSGTFDGAGHTIHNLNWTFTMSNDGNSNMPVASEDYSYVLENLEGALSGNRYARGAVSLLILQLDGGTVKDLTLADSSMTINCSYNKNYQMFFGAVVGYMNGGSVSDVTLVNVDMTIPKDVNYNQAYEGYAAPLVGRVSGEAAVTDCIVGSGCLVDASANVKFNTGTLVGVLEADSTLSIDGSSSEAECKVHPQPSLNGLPYSGADAVLGGNAGGLIGTALNQ